MSTQRRPFRPARPVPDPPLAGPSGPLRARRAATRIAAAAALLLAAAGPSTAQEPADPEQGVMEAAARWALEQVPGGDVCIDPHRSGGGGEAGRVRRVAEALGARVATLEETRRCADSMDPSTCELQADVLLALGEPAVRGATARTRVYVWSRTGDPRQPVRKQTFDLELRRGDAGWQVVAPR